MNVYETKHKIISEQENEQNKGKDLSGSSYYLYKTNNKFLYFLNHVQNTKKREKNLKTQCMEI